MNIKENIQALKSRIPAGVELVAVSKFHPASMILAAFEAGQRIFGESRVQEFLEKEKILPPEIQWHFIGHLQTNKVKPLIGKISLIESVDSEKLLNVIDIESEKAGVVTKILLQVHIAKEETKFGFYPEELENYFAQKKFEKLRATHICGLMGMATNTDDIVRIREDFRELHSLFEKIKQDNSLGLVGFNFLSMGMSGDWPIAVEEGANIIRIGSAIFGNREY